MLSLSPAVFIPGATFNQFSAMPWFIQLVFLIVIGVLVFRAVRWLAEWLSNNRQPVETTIAKVVSKREHQTRQSRGAGNQGIGLSRTRTRYFVTFEMETGERTEFKVSGNEYGMLTEGDSGQLTHQGTRYHGFQRAGTT
ncbi:DUF2500 domain-containing protein [Salisediminibacterium selenitireducens]|nr:DUF2500 domain-containing protein [Salisediminibacterium selenitireducens]